MAAWRVESRENEKKSSECFAQRYHHTKVQRNSPTGYKTRLILTSYDALSSPGEQKKKDGMRNTGHELGMR
jgi:hypothetical protein